MQKSVQVRGMEVPLVLSYLCELMKSGLAYSSLKAHLSAILASLPLSSIVISRLEVKQFLKEVLHLNLLRRPVPSPRLQLYTGKSHYASLRNISLSNSAQRKTFWSWDSLLLGESWN